MTVYVIVSEDGSQVLTNLDTGLIMAWEYREHADAVLSAVGDDYGPLHVESRELEEK